MGRTITPQHEADIYGALRSAAIAGKIAPTSAGLRDIAKCHLTVVAATIQKLEKDGKITRRGGTNTRSYFINALGKSTEPLKSRQIGAFHLKRDPKLTAIQRGTLSIARRLIVEHGSTTAKAVADEVGENITTISDRLTRAVDLGHLRRRADKTYGLAIPAEAAAPALLGAPQAQTRIEIRQGFPVPITICPPMLARGALVFRSALGFGGVALAGGGSQRLSGRP